MNLQDYAGAIWRRRWLVLAVIAVGLLAVRLVGLPESATSQYTASVTLSTNNDVDPAQVLLYTQVAEGTSEISDRVVADIGEGVYGDIPTKSALEMLVGTTADPDIGTLILTVQGQPSEEVARTVIESYTTNLVAFSGEDRIADRDAKLAENEARAAELETQVTDLSNQLRQLVANQTEAERAAGLSPDQVKETQRDVAVDTLTQVQTEIEELRGQSDEDLTSLRQVSEPQIVNVSESDPLGVGGRMILGFALSAALAVGLAVTLHRFDNRVFRRKDVETAFQLPVLAVVPNVGRLGRRNDPVVVRSRPDHPVSEAYRLLRSGLELARSRQLAQLGQSDSQLGAAILVVSASGGTGRTTTVANLAAAAVAAGKRVLVVGADLRGSAVGELLGIAPDALGLSDAVVAARAGRPVGLADYAVATAIPNVDVLPTGRLRINPGETLAEARFLIQEARRQYHLILIDTPPMLVGNDVSELVPLSDLVLVVARAGATTFDEGQWVDETAERLQAATCGVVLIGATSDLQRPGLMARLRGALTGRRRGAITPREVQQVVAEPVTAQRPGAGGSSVAHSAAGDRGADVPRVPTVVRGAAGAGIEAAGQPPAAANPAARTRPADHIVPAPTGEVPVTMRAGEAGLPTIDDVFGLTPGVGAEASGRPPAANSADATIQMEVLDPSRVRPVGPDTTAEPPPSPPAGIDPDLTIDPATIAAARAAAEGAAGDGQRRPDLPTFSDDLVDEEEPSIPVVRVTTGRSAGPASSLNDG